MKLTCKLGAYGEEIVEVKKTDTLSILMNLLNLKDKNSKFIYNRMTYTIYSNQTFEDIGLTSDTILYIINQAIAG